MEILPRRANANGPGSAWSISGLHDVLVGVLGFEIVFRFLIEVLELAVGRVIEWSCSEQILIIIHTSEMSLMRYAPLFEQTFIPLQVGG